MMPPRALLSRLVMEGTIPVRPHTPWLTNHHLLLGITVAQIVAILAKLVRTAVRVALLLVPNLALVIRKF